MIWEDPEGAPGASEGALCTGAICIEVGPVDSWLVARAPWLAGHATRLDDGRGPIPSNTGQACISGIGQNRAQLLTTNGRRVSGIQCRRTLERPIWSSQNSIRFLILIRSPQKVDSVSDLHCVFSKKPMSSITLNRSSQKVNQSRVHNPVLPGRNQIL
jgi:hypothetical protein